MSDIETKESSVLEIKKAIIEKMQEEGPCDVKSLRIMLELEKPRRQGFSVTLRSLLRDNGLEGINSYDPRYLEILKKVENAERLKFYTALSFLMQEKVIEGISPDNLAYKRKTEEETGMRIMALC